MALSGGVKAPEIALQSTTGKPVVLSEMSKRGPVVLAFFKVGCPTCQYAFPYLERISEAHKSGAVSFIGISQDNLADTEAFIRRYGVTFNTAIDDLQRYTVSSAYRLTNVPTVYLVDRDGRIQLSTVGWVRKDVEELNLKLAKMDSGRFEPPTVFKPGEEIAEYKAG